MADRGGSPSEGREADVMDALYALPPADFVAARDAAVRAAREGGDKDTARRLAALRRPTTSAWLVNLLYRHEREAVEDLLEIGEQLTEASRRLSGPELQRLSAQRSQVVQALVTTARRLAADAGVAVSATTAYELQSTLSAALADPQTAEEVRSGRMLRPHSYAGFGPEPEPGTTVRSGRAPAKQRASGQQDAKTSQRRQRAQKAFEDAQAAVGNAEAGLSDSEAVLTDARRVCDHLAEDHEALTAQLADLEDRQRQAADRVHAAEAAHRAAADQLHKAQRRLDEACERLHAVE